MPRPLELMIALHYHVHPTEYAADDPRHRDSGPTRGVIEDFVGRGMLAKRATPNRDGAMYEGTAALARWIEELTQVPLPPRLVATESEMEAGPRAGRP